MNFFQHDIGEEEIKAVGQAIRDGHITTGVKLKEFANSLEQRFHFDRVELCSSGTAALHLALVALGVGPGDEVITTPYIAVWTINPILMVGAIPVFADIDPITYNLDPISVAAKITSKTKVILPVSINAVPCDYHGLRRIAPDYVRIVCDDIEALGSTRQGKYVGEDVGRDVSVGGFWVSKQITTGGGGMVVSKDKVFMDKFEKLTRHGHGLVGDMWTQNFGFNYWLNDFQAAMGIVQLARFEEKQQRLLIVKDMLDCFFVQYRRQRPMDGDTSTEFIYLIELPAGVNKKLYSTWMAKQWIPTRPYFNNVMDVPHIAKYANSDCPIASALCGRTVALPYHWKLTNDEIAKIHEAHEKTVTMLGD